MSSGVTVDDDIVQIFNNFKFEKKLKFVAFKISDDYKKIVFDQTGGSYEGPYSEVEDFLKEIEGDAGKVPYKPGAGCRYAVVYFHYKTQGGQERSKILFVNYTSENAKTKDKMVYTSSKSYLRNKLEGADVDIQGNDLDDIKEVEVLDTIRRKFKD